MAVPATPEYSLFRQPLDVAGTFPLNQRIGYLHLWRFEDVSGALSLDGEILVSFGGQADDLVPLSYNTKVVFRPAVDRCSVSWVAQAGKVAVFLVSANPDFLIGDNQPAKQIVTSAMGTTVAVGNGTITGGAAAAQIRPANTLRNSLMLQNVGSSDLYVGPAGVTVATGLLVAAGTMLVLDKTTAAIFGVSSTTTDYRFLEELS